jgi:uncharacterized protein YunC (DUF1805 family)
LNANDTRHKSYADKLADHNTRRKAAPGPRERAAIKARYEEIISDPNFRPCNDFPVGRQKFVEFVNQHFGEGALPPPHLQVLPETNTGSRNRDETRATLSDRITGVDKAGEQLASRITGVETPGEQLAARITGVNTPGEQLAARISGVDTSGDELAARITGATMPGEQLAARITGATMPGEQLAARMTAMTQQVGKRSQGEHGRRFNKRGGIRKYRSHGSQ